MESRAMRVFFASCMVIAGIMLTGAASAQSSLTLSRADGAQIPALNYAASGGATCPPTLVLSHGLGGDERAQDDLAKAMAAQGWRVLAIAHKESGRAVLRQTMRQGGLAAIDVVARERPLHVFRFADLDAAFAEVTRTCRPKPLILAGHSMGAQTTMMEAGATALIGSMGSNRFDAYVALSPQGIGNTFAAGAWSGVSRPVLMITGTRDRTPDSDYRTRLTAFEGLPAGRKRLAVIPGAGHLQIGGVGSASVDTMVNTLVLEFAEQIASGEWSPSRTSGVTIEEK
jgi:alpha-beta hydrolase superfamily lysophospholipase